MVSRKQWFLDLRELIDSSESNFDHGRTMMGRRKLMRAYVLIGESQFSQKPSVDVPERG